MDWAGLLTVETIPENDQRSTAVGRSRITAMGAPVRVSNPEGRGACEKLIFDPDGGGVQLHGSLAEPAYVLSTDPGAASGLAILYRQEDDRFSIEVEGPGSVSGAMLGQPGRVGDVIEPTAAPFSDAQTTAVITCFEVGSRPRSVGMQRIAAPSDLGALDAGRSIRRERLEAANRWTPLTRSVRRAPAGFLELGELCRVHRGQVTGANRVWIVPPERADLPDGVLFPCVTRAHELFRASRVLDDIAALRRVIDLPVDLDVFEASDRRRIRRFLSKARALGVHRGFIASHRRAWWSVGLREPAPILATYMARRPPAFVLNEAGARHINIAHGLYPRQPLPRSTLIALASYLSSAVSTSEGRTYAGGLTKFEPKEMERLLVPGYFSSTCSAHEPSAHSSAAVVLPAMR